MKIAQYYSHLNGLEFLKVHKPSLWEEIKEVIASVDAEKCRTKVSKEARSQGKLFYSPKDMNKEFKKNFTDRTWHRSLTKYWVTDEPKIIRKTLGMEFAKQKEEIVAAGRRAIYSNNETDFVKERIAVEVQFGKYAFVAYDLFVKHMAFFVGDVIDVGVEVLPMKDLQAEMSSGVPYYEGALYDLIREGRGVPAVPLVLIGVTPENSKQQGTEVQS